MERKNGKERERGTEMSVVTAFIFAFELWEDFTCTLMCVKGGMCVVA